MFHADRDEEAAKADGVRQASILMQGCMFHTARGAIRD